MQWFKSQGQEAVSPEVFAGFLVKITGNVVKDTSQALDKQLDASEHSKLPKMEEELIYFFVFALDYWWTKDPKRTQEERLVVRQAFVDHLANIISLDTLQERLIAYAQIVNEEKGDKAKFLSFGKKLSEYCGRPLNPHLLVLAPALFTEALESLGTLKSVQLKFR